MTPEVGLRVSDIRPDDAMKGQAEAERLDIEWLKVRRHLFVPVPCPACRRDAFKALYEKNGMTHVACRECGTQYVTPRPSAETLRDFYASSANYAYWARFVFPASGAARRERLFRPRALKIKELSSRLGVQGGVLLEVGAAYGLFCDEVRKLGLFDRIIGIEPTPDLARICRDLGVEVIESSYESVRLETPATVIAHFEVIEHLFDPGRFAAWCHASLRPGGFTVFTCPNIAGLETLLLGRHSSAVDHEHLNLFTPESVSRLMTSQGFDVVEITTPGVLDLDLIRQAKERGRFDSTALDPVLRRLLAPDDAGFEQRLLAVLQEARLTSNMMMVARRPG